MIHTKGETMKRYMILLVVAFTSLGASTSCYQVNEAEEAQREATESIQAEAQAQVGMPDIFNFTERRQMKDILELRDKPDLLTFTYIVNMDGDLLPLCRSIGYGLPYSVQYTNPSSISRRAWGSGAVSEGMVLPQPDPNGLYMPEGLSATWVLCVDPGSGKPDPVYVEPSIIVSRFELDFGGWGNPGR